VRWFNRLCVYRHATNGPPLQVNPPVVRVAGDVKSPQSPPNITTDDASAIRLAAKYGWGSPPFFDIPKWVFSGLTATTRIDTFALTCNNVTREIRGLCAGDVNATYLPPNGNKMGIVETRHALSLQNRGTLPITQEIAFPVRADNDMEIGAITLMLDYDPARIEITGVEMPENGGVEPWFETRDGVLNIGWMSLDPVRVFENGTVVMIHARANAIVETGLRPVSTGSPIRFTLNDNPLSELADGDGNVIDGAKLSVADAGANDKTVKWQKGNLVCYPNPAHSTLNLELETFNPEPVTLNLELVNLHGVVVMKCEPETISAGWHKDHLDVRGIAPGVYFLRAKLGGEVIIQKVLISR